jgi:hypothetical protein
MSELQETIRKMQQNIGGIDFNKNDE